MTQMAVLAALGGIAAAFVSYVAWLARTRQG